MKIIFIITLNPLTILAPPFHSGGTGIWDEVVSIVGSIVFIAILIHIFFFEKPNDESPPPNNKTMGDDNKNKRL